MDLMLNDLRPKGCRRAKGNWKHVTPEGTFVYPPLCIWHKLSNRLTAAWQVLARKYYRMAWQSTIWGHLGGLVRGMRQRGETVEWQEEVDHYRY